METEGPVVSAARCRTSYGSSRSQRRILLTSGAAGLTVAAAAAIWMSTRGGAPVVGLPAAALPLPPTPTLTAGPNDPEAAAADDSPAPAPSGSAMPRLAAKERNAASSGPTTTATARSHPLDVELK